MAFHPVDGVAQSLAYHLLPLVYPMPKVLYLTLFVAVQVWTPCIHEGNPFPDAITHHPFINGPNHHENHHLFFTTNYGQYFTLFDKLFKSYR